MNKIVIVYQSKYGSTEKYAHWLAEELSCDLVSTNKANINDIKKYDTIILGGGIYATGIAGISFLKKNYNKLKLKKIAIFAVGASPYDEKAMVALKERNLKGELSVVPCFYCRGAWNEDLMSWKDRTICNMLKKAVSKKDSSTYEPWEKALMQAIGSKSDWTNKNNLKSLIDYVHSI